MSPTTTIWTVAWAILTAAGVFGLVFLVKILPELGLGWRKRREKGRAARGSGGGR